MGGLQNLTAACSYTNNKINAITKANKPIDSAKPAPINTYLDSFCSAEGFLAILVIALEKMFPSPIAAPANANAHNPIAINLRASSSIIDLYKKLIKKTPFEKKAGVYLILIRIKYF